MGYIIYLISNARGTKVCTKNWYKMMWHNGIFLLEGIGVDARGSITIN